MKVLLTILVALTIFASPLDLHASDQIAAGDYPVTDGPSLQKALDANPGRVIFVPPGDYEISEPIVIAHDNSGLYGAARIVQTNPDAAIIIISRANGVRLRDLTLARPADKPGATSGLVANSCQDLSLENLQVLDNCAASSAINLDRCASGTLSGTLVRNYTRISIDDRTNSENYGFAFNCIDGTGIQLTSCQAMLVQGNRVVEQKNLPTAEIKEKHNLGEFTAKNPQKGRIVAQDAWDSESFPQWHQGSAIVISHPERTDQIQLLGNYIENAAQAIDIHADHVAVANNIVNNAAVGIKAMHGSRNTLIIGNQFIKCDAHGILLQPGAASHLARRPNSADPSSADAEANTDGGTIVANNIISDFGYGNAHWIWGNERSPISLEHGQLPENPPLRDVVIQGNVVYDPGRDRASSEGDAAAEPPRYRHAVTVTPDSNDLQGPRAIRFSNNILHPGTAGVSNADIEP